MADNDYNIIKPVEGLQNIAGLTGTKRREQRKRRQNLPSEHDQERESTEDGLNESVNQENHDSKPTDDEGPPSLDPARDSPARGGQEPAGTQNDRHSIDYCA